MRLPLVGFVLVALLSNCAGMGDYASEVTSFESDGDDLYRIVDEPAGNKLVVTPSLSRLTAQNAATFMSLAGSKNPVVEKVALSYLGKSGRACRLLNGNPVGDMRWEYTYDCSPPAKMAANL